MQFNRFIFDNYLATEEGKNALSFFNDFENVFKQEKIKPYFDFLNHVLIEKIESEKECKEILQEQYEIIKDIYDDEFEEDDNLDSEFNLDEILDEVKKNLYIVFDENSDASERDFLPFITAFSLLCYFSLPEVFFPYYFFQNFTQLEKILHEFSIPLPPLPGKRKYKERFDYYFELCRVFYDFRKEHNLSPQEFCVFLYYFAPHLIDKVVFQDDLPEATKVYICGTTKGDLELIEKYTTETIAPWGGSVNMQVGDIVLLYEIKPVGAIRSIFRCLTQGFLDPFGYFMDEVWLGKMQKIPAITYDDLKSNDVWKTKSVVVAHMQGLSGSPCTSEEYDAIKEILKSKGFDVSILPNLQYTGLANDVELKVEKDVEEFLLEPLLKKIGFTEKNWKRQLPVRMGRGERNYPDYALFPKGTKGEETAWFLWEAKLTIHNRKELLDAFLQAKSYALRLESIGFGLVAREGVWLSFKKDSFLFEKIISYTWSDLANTDKFNEFMLLTKR